MRYNNLPTYLFVPLRSSTPSNAWPGPVLNLQLPRTSMNPSPFLLSIPLVATSLTYSLSKPPWHNICHCGHEIRYHGSLTYI